MSWDALSGVCGIDFETTSYCDIKQGAWAYSRHDSTKVYCAVVGYATAAGHYDVKTWEPGEPLPPEFVDFVRAGGSLVAHNASFEQAIWQNVLGIFHGWPPVALHQWRDTQALGLALNLPASLDGLAKALGCPQKKDKEGHDLMKVMATAVVDDMSPGGYRYPGATRANRDRLLVYCERDVRATLDAWFRMPALSVTEQRVWALDQEINARGVFLDRPFAAKCIKITNARKRELADAAIVDSEFELTNATSAPALKTWLRERGVELPKVTRKKADGTYHKTESADRHAVATILVDPELPKDVRKVLDNRVEANKATSLAKLQRVATMVGGDGRLRGALQYCGAHTGRWTSSGLQVHNLPKDKLGADTALARLLVQDYGLEGLKLFFDRPLAVLSMLLRSILAAPEGREFIAADFAAIEARVLTWLVDDRDLLGVFARGEDVYVYTAEAMSATCDHPWREDCSACVSARQLGKVCRLALGYGMGALKLADTGGKDGIALDLKEWRSIQKTWRDTNPLVVDFWKDIEKVVKAAIFHPGKTFACGRLQIYVKGACLFIRLPSGRCLRYWQPCVRTVEKRIKTLTDEGVIVERVFETEEIQFSTMGPDKTRMVRESTYGGKLTENVVQAIARDLLGEAMLRVDSSGLYKIVVHVHDSAASEVPAGAGSVDEFCELMAVAPNWASGCPIAVEGYRDVCFRG